MSYGAGGGDQPIPPGGMLASEAERERTQAVLKQAFEDQRLTQDEFESRIGSAISARTQGQLAALTRDLPAPLPAAVPAGRRPRRTWLLIAGIAAVAVIGAIFPLISAFNSGTAQPGTAPARAAKPAKAGHHSLTTMSGPARCPVGTPAVALAIANALAADPVYVDPASSMLTAGQADRLRAEISQADPGRIRLAAVTNATVRQGGSERALANAISSCPADAAGVTVVTTAGSTYLVTSYTDYRSTSQAVGAALNTHTSMGAGLRDAVRRMAVIDPGS
jgi:DUF1707 SHOCT-like domain